MSTGSTRLAQRVNTAALPIQVIAILSSFVFALNFCLEMLAVFGPGRVQQVLLSALLTCLAAWAVAEALLLRARNRVLHLRLLTVLLVVQVALECSRLILVFTGLTGHVNRMYGIGKVDVGITAVLLGTYLVVFLAICRALMKIQLAELGDAYSALQTSNAKLEELATTDALTGAVNRRQFEDNAVAAITDSPRRTSAVSLLLLDVDNFKTVNDRHGHLVGDRVLAALVRLARQNLRTDDSVGRWGGEEFAVLMPHCDLQTSTRTAERLRDVVAGYEFESVGNVTISIGVAQHAHGEPFDEWMSRADAALYAAKRRGRDNVVADRARRDDRL